MPPALLISIISVKNEITWFFMMVYFCVFCYICLKKPTSGRVRLCVKNNPKKPKYIPLLLIPLVVLEIFCVVLTLRFIFNEYTPMDVAAMNILSMVIMVDITISQIKNYFKKDC